MNFKVLIFFNNCVLLNEETLVDRSSFKKSLVRTDEHS